MAQVSIIVPVYNVAYYIEKCLASIAAQTFTDMEVIIVDDGSTDGSGVICDEWASRDRRFRVVHQENRGLSEARNVGLDNATGEYVQFVDSDDYVDSRYTKTLLDVAKRYGCACAVCGYASMYRGGWSSVSPSSCPSVVSAHGYLCRMLGIERRRHYQVGATVWNCIFRRSLFDDGGIHFPEGHVYEDVWIAARMIHKSQLVALIPDVLYYKSDRSDSIMSTDSLRNTVDLVTAYETLRDDIELLFPDLLPMAQGRCERVRIIGLLRLAGIKGDVETDVAFDKLRKAAVTCWDDLSLPQDVHFAFALFLVTVAPRSASWMYNAWCKIRGRRV